MDTKRAEAIELFKRAGAEELTGSLGQAIELYSRAFRLEPNVEDYVPRQEAGAVAEGTRLIQPINAGLVAELLTSGTELKENRLFPREPCPLLQLPPSVAARLCFYVAQVSMHTMEQLGGTCRVLYLHCRADGLWQRMLSTLEADPVLDYPSRLQYVYTPGGPTAGLYIARILYCRRATHDSGFSFTSPIRLVTYYRYLRFYGPEEGARCISWVTTEPPSQGLVDRLRHWPAEYASGMYVGSVASHAVKDDRHEWVLHLFNPDKIAFQLKMTLRSGAVAMPTNTAPHARPPQHLACTAYEQPSTSTEDSDIDTRAVFDIDTWGKFLFSRVRSY